METAVWNALADPNRRAILGQLLQGPRPVGALAETCGLSQPSTSKHLRVLRDAGLVRVERAAQRRLYLIEPAPMADLDAWLAPYRRLWNAGLDALGRRLDAERAEPDPDAERVGPDLDAERVEPDLDAERAGPDLDAERVEPGRPHPGEPECGEPGRRRPDENGPVRPAPRTPVQKDDLTRKGTAPS
jgi:DNA-binding transcriptional ArsR family regulator